MKKKKFDTKDWYSKLPKNERFLVQNFVNKGFEYCRCWHNAGYEFHLMDTRAFGVSLARMHTLLIYVVRHLTGAEVIPALKKRRVIRRK